MRLLQLIFGGYDITAFSIDKRFSNNFNHGTITLLVHWFELDTS